jgi:O-antigen/teichoic acid export membrane protein
MAATPRAFSALTIVSQTIHTNELIKKLFAGAGFRTASIVLTRLVSVARVMLFARMFAPDQIGVAALVSSSVAMIAVLGELGLTQSIIRDNKESTETSDTAFSLSVISSAAVFLLIVVIAPLLSNVLHTEISSYVRFLAVAILATPLSLPRAFWDRSLTFGPAAVIPLIAELVSFISAVAVELSFHASVWSLLIGQVAGTVVAAFYVWAFAEKRPRLRLNYAQVTPLFAFGLPFMVQQINGIVMQRGDNLIIGAICGPVELAYYAFAWQLPMIVSSLAGSVDGMLFPVYARLNGQQERVRQLFNLSNKMWSLFANLIIVPMIVYAESIVRLIYGPAWLPAIPILQVMLLSFVVRFSTGYAYDNIVLVRGRTRYMLKWGVINTVLVFTVGWLMIQRMGTIGGAWFWFFQSLFLVPLVRWPIIRQELGTLEYLRYVWQPVVAGILSGLVCGQLLRILPEHYILQLASGVVSYVAIYLAILFLIDHRLVSEVRRMAVMLGRTA